MKSKDSRSEFLDPAIYTPCFEYRHGSLHCEGVALAKIADRADTPAYVYSNAAFSAAYRDFRRAIQSELGRVPSTVCYAVKANSNLAVLRALAHLGSSFDIVSRGELFRLQRAGVPGRRIVFSGVGKKREEIREALRAEILLFNVESEEELEVLASEASRLRVAAPSAIRVNPDVGAGGHPHIATGDHRHKFGVDWPEARRLYLRHRQSLWIDWKGISGHIGSQITSMEPFRIFAGRLADYFRDLSRQGIVLRYLDIGGGLGIRYATENPLSLREYASSFAPAIRKLGCHVLLEPGRALIGSAGVLLTRVLYTKRTHGKTFVIVDAAMNDLIRPALYNATHPITTVNRPRANAEFSPVDIMGPVCETGDFFLRNWSMPEVHSGDLLVIWVAGAYGAAESSNYNSRPRAAEILVEGGRFRLVRRRESRADLIRGEHYPQSREAAKTTARRDAKSYSRRR
ncbi:MAG TPA: diaminopimelate decarboxylase [Candidatus Acidoferrales bacterium]|nr:diaminopimelate decarboxylase [Candidatus Acidoferrales bacterium]